MDIKLSAELKGSEITEYFVSKVKENGIVLNEGTYKIQASVFSDKKNEFVTVDLDKIKFILNRE